MTSFPEPKTAPEAPPRWGPQWARILAWIAMAPAAMGVVLGIRVLVLGLGSESDGILSSVMGPFMILSALCIAVLNWLFLKKGGVFWFVLGMLAVVWLTPVFFYVT